MCLEAFPEVDLLQVVRGYFVSFLIFPARVPRPGCDQDPTAVRERMTVHLFPLFSRGQRCARWN
ncbi:hypothetical protein SGPA1_30684 [Streptomyces misionensis JCM 4497]